MKITIHKQMRLNVAEVLLSLEREVERPDIKAYLNGNGYENKMLDNGVKNYLRKVGIFDENFQLTKYGSNVKETGIFKAREMGKYKIWIDEQRIVFLQRFFPVDKNYDRLGPIVIDKEGFSIPANNENFYRFELKNQKNITGKYLPNEEYRVDETIEIREDGSSTVFSGSVQKGLPVSGTPIPENVEAKGLSLWEMVDWIFQSDWNKNSKRFKIRLKDLKDYEIENFEMNVDGNKSPYDYYNKPPYDYYRIDNLLIEPYDGQEATEWRNRLLNKEITKNYLPEKNFDGLVLSINGNEGFSSYKHTLDKPDIRNYLRDEIEPNSQEFWHLYAPLDLNPGIPKEIILEYFEIEIGRSNMLEIVGKINFRDPDFVFYCDSYTGKNHQQKIVAAFLDATGAKSKYLLTRTSQSKDEKRSHYLETQRKDIKVSFLEKWQHRRCIVFYKGEESQIWNLDDSVDFIRYNVDTKIKITPTDIGEIERPVVFTKVSDKVLGKEILNFIQQEVKNV